MTTPRVGRAAAIAFPAILVLLGTLFVVAYLITALLGLPASFGPPLAVQVAGAVVVIVGISVAGWVFAYRTPASMVVSTYITLRKLFAREPISEPLGRKEPLVVTGPQKHVRHPLYFGVIVMAFGWALYGGATFVLVGAVGLLLWFWFVLIPFEEKELKALFGDQYARYAGQVPMLIPFTKRKR